MSTENKPRSRTALISVFEKRGVVAEFAQGLEKRGFNILASRRTAEFLQGRGVKARDVAEITNLPPILGHKVVTLSAPIHAGLLAKEEERGDLERLGFPWIDLVWVELYPLVRAVKEPDATRQSIIDLTDIGGPALLRSAAKGRRIVIGRDEERIAVECWLQGGEKNSDEFRNRLAAAAEGVVAEYCLASASFHSGGEIGAGIHIPRGYVV